MAEEVAAAAEAELAAVAAFEMAEVAAAENTEVTAAVFVMAEEVARAAAVKTAVLISLLTLSSCASGRCGRVVNLWMRARVLPRRDMSLILPD
jgi:hypothetical protein